MSACTSPARLTERGLERVDAGNCEEGVPDLERAIQRDSTLGRAYYGLGVCALGRRAPREAVSAFVTAAGLGYAPAVAQEGVARVAAAEDDLERGRLRSARSQIADVLGRPNRSSEATIERAQRVRGRLSERDARSALRAGEFTAAHSHVRSALADLGHSPDLGRLRADVYAAELETVAARLATYRRAREASLLVLAGALERANAAREEARSDARVRRHASVVYRYLAEIVSEPGRSGYSLENALRFANRAIELAPANSALRSLRSDIHLRLAWVADSFETRARHGESALTDDPRSDGAKRFLVDLYLDRAIHGLEQANRRTAAGHLRRLAQLDDRFAASSRLLAEGLRRAAPNDQTRLAQAELHLDALEYQDALALLRRTPRSGALAARAVYARARAHAALDRTALSLRELFRFYNDDDLRPHYARYARLATAEPDFIALASEDRFRRWTRGHRRVAFELTRVTNIPDSELIGAPEIHVVVANGTRDVLTTSTHDTRLHTNGVVRFEPGDYRVVFDYVLARGLTLRVYDDDLFEDDLVGLGHFEDEGPGTWRYRLQGGPVVHATISDASFAPTERATHARDIDGNPLPGIASLDRTYAQYRNGRFSAISVGTVGLQIAGCTSMLAISLYTRGFLNRQVASAIVGYITDNRSSLRSMTQDAIIEAIVDQTGIALLRTGNSLRTYARCVSAAVSG